MPPQNYLLLPVPLRKPGDISQILTLQKSLAVRDDFATKISFPIKSAPCNVFAREWSLLPIRHQIYFKL